MQLRCKSLLLILSLCLVLDSRANSDIYYNSSQIPAAELDIISQLNGDHPSNLALAMGDLSIREWRNLYRVFPETLRRRAESSPSANQEVTLRRYGLYQDPLQAMPAAFTRLKNGEYRANCLFCHGGPIATPNGSKFLVGAPNRRADVAAFFKDRIELKHRFPEYSSAKGLVERFAFPAFSKLLDQFEPNLNRGTPSVWMFGAIEMELRTIQMRYDLRSLINLMRGRSDDYGVVAVDVDPLPWWNTRFKDRLWMDGFIPKSGRALSLVVPGPGNNLRRLEPTFDKLLDSMSAIEVPKYPLAIDFARADRGKVIFAKNCAGCHGTYSGDGRLDWPGKTIPLSKVQTDPARVLLGMTQSYREAVQRSWVARYGKDEIRVNPEGYLAPPLRGVWASAPYLHNGSVPTLGHFLEIDERPTYWTSNLNQYDWNKVGLAVSTFTTAPNVEEAVQVEIFDTTRFGKSNAGHPFHRKLNLNERSDVLEYLKTL